MKTNLISYILLMLGSILIACVSQVMLKKAAMKHYDRFIDQYLNLPVILAYGLFFGSTVFSMLAYRGLPLSATPVFNALSQLLVAVSAFLFFKERPNRKRLMGLGLVVLGIVIFSL